MRAGYAGAMELRADRVLLRSPTQEDADAIITAVRFSAEELIPWMPWAHENYGPEDVAGWLRETEANPDAHQFCVFLDMALVGSAGIWRNSDGIGEIGYSVRTDATGRGIATSAARVLADYGFSQLGYTDIVIKVDPANIASQRVAEKVGAQRLPDLYRHPHADGTEHVLVEFRLRAMP